MSDAKPRRIGRESERSETAAGEGGPPDAARVTVSPVAPEAGHEPGPDVAAPPAGTAAPHTVGESAERLDRAPDVAWTALAELQAALTRGFEEIAVEMTAIARSEMATATDAATAMLGTRTFAEAVEVGAGLMRRRADAMVEASARLSEIVAQSATDASRAILAPLSLGWGVAGRGSTPA